MPDGRSALVSAATAIFAERGYEAADLRSIARAAGVNPGLVRVHFGAKAGLWDACVNAVVAQQSSMLAEIGRIASQTQMTVAGRLALVIRQYVDFAFANPEVRQFIVRHASESDERATLLVDRLVRPAYEVTLPLIRAGIDSGIIRVRHPTAFFGMLNNAVNPPRSASALLHRLSADIAPDGIQELLSTSILEAFLHEPILSRAQARKPRTAREPKGASG